ncbi:MAG: hypothetical protein KDI19_09855 [Pseudomonadales bacterium]|nr:hypothetical protein [Pseudomonadales bacterium]
MRYQFTAFLNNPDAPRPENPIHSTDGGRQHGFKGALVGGIHVYGWTTGAFLELLGDEWLDSGWVDVAFRRPTYDGDAMSVNINGNEFTATNAASEVCLQGRVGLGKAPFLDDIHTTRFTPAVAQVDPRPNLTLDNAPRAKRLAPMSVPLSAAEHRAFLDETLRETNHLFHGEDARCHPAWVAGRPIYLLHHSFEYGPAVHTRSQVQHLAPARVGQQFTVTGHCEDAFEKNGHHYIVNDASLWGEQGDELARMRHTAIFRLRTA